MIDNDLDCKVAKLRSCLPVNYQLRESKPIDRMDILRTDVFPYYNSLMSICKSFHRPISKLHGKEGRI